MKNIENLKKGDFFKRKATAKKVFQRGSYNQSSKRYDNPDYNDINNFCYLKKGTKVFTDFDF